MTDQNHVFLIGRLTRDIGADERSFAYVGSNNTARANISIAVNRSVKKNDQWTDEVSYFDVQIWGKTAENLKQYLQKGKQIAIDGYLKQDRWQKDGQNFSRVYVVANTVQLLSGTKNDNAQNEPQQQYTPNNDDGGFPEDIPF
jgi:single-strand DNA-binding protein